MRSAFLLLAKPANWVADLGNNSTIHTAKLEKWEKGGPIGNSTSNFGTTTDIAIGKKSGQATQFWWDGIGVCLNIGRRRIADL
jgi:hypothetical protein